MLLCSGFAVFPVPHRHECRFQSCPFSLYLIKMKYRNFTLLHFLLSSSTLNYFRNVVIRLFTIITCKCLLTQHLLLKYTLAQHSIFFLSLGVLVKIDVGSVTGSNNFDKRISRYPLVLLRTIITYRYRLTQHLFKYVYINI
jgi:hypothetical protein